jgi:hypothetical protein
MAEHTANTGVFPPRSGTTERARLEGLLRVALEQWPFKNEADREVERRLIARDVAAIDALNRR